MELSPGVLYKLTFDVAGKTLTYTTIIQEDSEGWVTFKDKYNKILSYNKDKLISVEALDEQDKHADIDEITQND